MKIIIIKKINIQNYYSISKRQMYQNQNCIL